MKWLNVSRINVAMWGLIMGFLAGGGIARADFTFGKPVNLGPVVNGDSFEEKPCVSADGLTLYFASDRPGGYDEAMDDIWRSTRPTKDDPWGPAENLGPVVNSEVGEFHPSVSADELELYFERWENGTGSDIYNFSIWMTKRANKDAAWEEPIELNLTIPSRYMAAAPSISADGLELYFSIARFGDEPQGQLYMTKRVTRDAPWGEPTSLGPVVNSWSSQVQPAISNDGLLLLFNDWWAYSPRPGGFGNDDIWFTRRATRNDDWEEPVNAGGLINTPGWEMCGTPSADGSTLYFSSDRPGGHEGVDDLWQAPIIPIVDFNADEKVNLADLVMLIDHWGTSDTRYDIGPMPWGDGKVDKADLEVFMGHWEQEPYDPTLIAHWQLDETEGIIAHDSVGINDGTLVGAPTWRPTGGKVGGALEFDGVEDFVGTPLVVNPADGPFSVRAWVKGGMPGHTVVSQTNGANWLMAGPMGTLTTSLSQPAGRNTPTPTPLASETTVTDSNWHRIAFTWDGVKRALYVDEVLVAEDTQTGLPASSGQLLIGCGHDMAPGTFWQGLIDDVRIYNRAVKP